MQWNSSQIKEYYDLLKKEDPRLFSKKQKCAYEHDLNNLHNMLNYINQKKLTINRGYDVLLDEDYYAKVLEWLKTYGYKILFSTRNYVDCYCKDTHNIKGSRLDEENISRLSYLFLKDYNEQLKEKLFELNNSSHIYYDNRKSKKTIGETLNLINAKESYIILNRSDRLDSPLVLTREITKANDFSKNPEIEAVQNRNNSPFAYAYANFNELVMLD